MVVLGIAGNGANKMMIVRLVIPEISLIVCIIDERYATDSSNVALGFVRRCPLV